jgi:6-phosphogluconate dehydrogenase
MYNFVSKVSRGNFIFFSSYQIWDNVEMNTLGLIGLGKMGGNMARRLAKSNITVIGFDADVNTLNKLASEQALHAVDDLASLVASLPQPRLLWTMLPAGAISEATIAQLIPLLSKGDCIIDGANARYKDSQARSALLAQHGIDFIDVGVSGGIWGLQNGYCLMIGGSPSVVARAQPIFEALAPNADQGWLHCGPVGSGHYVKMVHNGIEYGMMQALAEGFALLDGKKDLALPVGEIANLWQHGSVVRSWLLELTADALEDPQRLDEIAPFVADSGEGRWTVDAAVELGIPAPVLSMALMMRFATQGKNDYSAKLLALMRQGFGGHAVQKQ